MVLKIPTDVQCLVNPILGYEVGKDKVNLDNDFLTWWVASIRLEWADCSNVPFTIGVYYKELGTYKSKCLDILYDLISKIEDDFDRKNLETSMRKVINTDVNQPIANFLSA